MIAAGLEQDRFVWRDRHAFDRSHFHDTAVFDRFVQAGYRGDRRARTDQAILCAGGGYGEIDRCCLCRARCRTGPDMVETDGGCLGCGDGENIFSVGLVGIDRGRLPNNLICARRQRTHRDSEPFPVAPDRISRPGIEALAPGTHDCDAAEARFERFGEADRHFLGGCCDCAVGGWRCPAWKGVRERGACRSDQSNGDDGGLE